MGLRSYGRALTFAMHRKSCTLKIAVVAVTSLAVWWPPGARPPVQCRRRKGLFWARNFPGTAGRLCGDGGAGGDLPIHLTLEATQFIIPVRSLNSRLMERLRVLEVQASS